MSKLFDLSGKTALLTGASKGMGLAMATALAEPGAKVVISARKQEARSEGTLEESKATNKDSGREFEKEAPLSTSHQFLYKVGNGDVWRLTELVMVRYLGKEVYTILEATFNIETKPGNMK